MALDSSIQRVAAHAELHGDSRHVAVAILDDTQEGGSLGHLQRVRGPQALRRNVSAQFRRRWRGRNGFRLANLPREIDAAYDAAVADRERRADHVTQLPDVARPGIS